MVDTAPCLGGCVFLCHSLLFFATDELLEGGVFLVLVAARHFEAVLVGEYGEVGLRLEDEDVATLVVLGGALHAVHGHEDAALAVGVGEGLVAETVVEGFGALVRDFLGAVLEVDDDLGFALWCETCDVEDGDELGVGCQQAYASVGEGAVGPALVDDEVAVFEVAAGAVTEAVLVEAFADEEAVVVVLDEASFDAAADVDGGDVAVLADALPPAAVTVVVGPVGHFGGVALGGVDDVWAVFDAHLVGGFFDEASLLVEEFPEAVAVALVVGACGEEVALLVEGFVAAHAAGLAVGVADADGAVVVVVGEDAGLKAVDEGAFVDF